MNIKQIKQISLRITTAAGVLAASTLFAQMNHANHGGHQHAGNAPMQPAPALPEPVQTVFTNYLDIQTALAGDSLQGVKDSATAILTSIRSDSAGTFSVEVAQAAENLAKTTDLEAARQAFKGLSENLIKHLEAHKQHAPRFERVFCSMANAQWLQRAGTPVSNPYLGRSMARCGQIES